MDTTELIKNSLDWADKRLDLKGEKLTEEQRNYITFALRHNLVKNINVIQCCKSDSELLVCDCENTCDELSEEGKKVYKCKGLPE